VIVCILFSFTESDSSSKTVFEKVYLHLDRHFYLSGDDIWFKAYLINVQTNKLSSRNSRILYAELISPESKILERKVLYVDSAGCSTGDFRLRKTAPSEKYRVRAYTKWMLNFGDVFVFEKEIEVQYVSDNSESVVVNKKDKNNHPSEKAVHQDDRDIYFDHSQSNISGGNFSDNTLRRPETTSLRAFGLF
jgi:uncharacterized protein YfaS (alpha-2-macroglobulin family)